MPTTTDRPRDPDDGFDREERPTDPWPDAEGGTSGLDGAMPRQIDGTLPISRSAFRGEGDCYEAAGKVMIEDGLNTSEFGYVSADEVLLCHGQMTRPLIGGHAWNEADGHVFDLSNGRITYMPIDEYYETFGIKDVYKYTKDEAFRIMLKLQQWGPWYDDPRLTHKEATVDLSHLIGSKDERFSFLPALPTVKEARRDYSFSEKSALIEENPDKRARNQGKLDLAGTHYISSTPEELDDLTNPLFW